MDSGNSGISVIESPPRGQAIPVSRESVTAFIGPTPRGPVDIPVAVRSREEFLARFGVPGMREPRGIPAEPVLRERRHARGRRAGVPLRAPQPHHVAGPLGRARPRGAESRPARAPAGISRLRRDRYRQITERFNLVIHRCRSPSQPLVEEQEIYSRHLRGSAPSPDYAGNALAGSGLVRSAGRRRPSARRAPSGRPATVRYVYSRSGVAGRQYADGLRSDRLPRWKAPASSRSSRCRGSISSASCPECPGANLGPVALFAAERYCRERHALLLLDPPATWASVDDVVRTQRQRGFASANALTYFPALESPPRGGPAGCLSAAGAIAGRLCASGLDVSGRLPLSLGRSRPSLSCWRSPRSTSSGDWA